MKNNRTKDMPLHIRNVLYYEEEEPDPAQTDKQHQDQQSQTKPRDPLSQETQSRFTI